METMTAINAFGTVQARYFSANPFIALLGPVFGFVMSLILQRITDTYREWKAAKDDGKKSAYEEMWDDETEEAEDDVMGLVVSFTTVGAIRFMISGCLPNQEGKEEDGCPEEYLFHHTITQKVMLLCTGIAFTIILFIVTFKWPEWA